MICGRKAASIGSREPTSRPVFADSWFTVSGPSALPEPLRVHGLVRAGAHPRADLVAEAALAERGDQALERRPRRP